MSAKKPFILVDGSSYLFRAYYALPPLTNQAGEPTGAMYGVLNMLRKLVTDYQPEHMVVVFDPKGKTLRHEWYEAYKANRTVMPDDLQLQIAPLHDMIRALGLPLMVVPGVEADDVIGTLARQAEQAGLPVLISTGDKDMAQLVNAHITLVNTMNGQVLDPEAVKTKFGVSPAQIIDYLSLTGDTSDNIPGVPGVGPKTAVKWIQEYGSLAGVIAAAPSMKGKVGENLRAHLDDLPLCERLVTIKCDIPLPQTVHELKPAEPNRELLREFFTRYEFKNWLTELSASKPTVTPAPSSQAAASVYTTIQDEATWQAWLRKAAQSAQLAFDTETTSLSAVSAELVGLSMATEAGAAAYLPLAHQQAPFTQLSRTQVLQQLQPLLQDPNKTLIGHNLKYDLEVLLNYGVQVQAKLCDTLLESYVLNSGETRHDLESLAKHYLNRDTIAFETVAGKGVNQKTFDYVPIDQATQYAAEDADVTLALHHRLWPVLASEERLRQVFDEIDMPLVPILARMEHYGVMIDAACLAAQSAELAQQVAALEQQAYAEAGETFNLASPKQLQTILFDKLNIPPAKKTPGGQASTAESVLQELAHQHALPKIILEYRTLSKLKSTYTDKLPLQINPKTQRIHTSYNQAVTVTGRLSSNNPNLQNIPIRREEGRRIRQAFVAPAGYRLVSADYSQIELRIIAHVSQDPGLLKAFREGLDVHRATAAEVFGVAFDQVTPEQRRHAKTINFGLLYGMSAFGLSQTLGIDRASASHYMETYFKRYPNVHAYMQATCEFAAKHGYVESIFGRRVHIPEIRSKNVPRRKAAERAAINAPMQSSAADIIKKAMICVDSWIEQSAAPVHMIMQVHDELVLEVRDDYLDTAIEHLRDCMDNAVQLSVPVTVDIGVGRNWDEAH